MKQNHDLSLTKVPEVTFLFWVIKIAATTLGETGGDALSMSLGLGYLLSTGVFAVLFILAVYLQIKSKTFHPVIYWFTIIATTTVGTTIADFADRSLGIGYAGGSTLLLTLLMISLGVWYKSLGSISIYTVKTPKEEVFYWTTIMISQTLGTALGDWMADSTGLGYLMSALVFGGAIAIITILHYKTEVSKTLLFWSAFILTRPLGAVVGDFLDKPITSGGLSFDRFTASLMLLLFIGICLKFFKHQAASRSH